MDVQLIWKTANGLFKWKAQGCPFDFIADFDGLWEAVKIVVLDPIRLFLEDSAVRSFFESEAESDWADRWLAIHEEGRMVSLRSCSANNFTYLFFVIHMFMLCSIATCLAA